jgi:hypothetical protein
MLLTLAFLACGQLVKTDVVETKTVVVKVDTNRAYLVVNLEPITTTALVVPYDGKLGTELPNGDVRVGVSRLELVGEFKRLDNPIKCQQFYSDAIREFRKVKVPAKPRNKNDRRLYPQALKKAEENQKKAIKEVAYKHEITLGQLNEILEVGKANDWPIWDEEKKLEASKTR